MNTIIIVLSTIIIIISIIAISYITLYNKIQFSKIRIEEAERVILEELKIRYDLIMSSKTTIEKNTKMDLSMFQELETRMNSKITSFELERKITEVIATIYLIKNDYPKIEEKKEFKEIIRKLNESDTKIIAAKSFYNKNNAQLNALVKAFPSNLLAMIHNIKPQGYYDGKEIFNEIDDGIKI